MPNRWVKFSGVMGQTRAVLVPAAAVALVVSTAAVVQRGQSPAGIVSQAAAQVACTDATKIVSDTGGSVVSGGDRGVGLRYVSGTVIVHSCTTGQVRASQGNDRDLLFNLGRATSPALGYIYSFAPCLLRSGDDLPGAKVTITYQRTDDPTANATSTLTLADDTEPPQLDVHSKPQKGHKVKNDDKIMVTITADETAPVSGHFGWQTGVESIELLADGVHFDGKRYGPAALPCDRKSWKQTFETTYTVKLPEPPPPFIRLTARAKDYHPNTATKDAEFPTGDWYGTLKGHGQGHGYNDTVEIRFSFSETKGGTIKGSGRATVMSKEEPFAGYCVHHHHAPDPFDISIGGDRVGDEFQLVLSNPRMPVVFSGTCRYPNGTSQSNTITPTTSGLLGTGSGTKFLRPKVAARDGATNELNSTTGDIKVEATIELHQAAQD